MNANLALILGLLVIVALALIPISRLWKSRKEKKAQEADARERQAWADYEQEVISRRRSKLILHQEVPWCRVGDIEVLLTIDEPVSGARKLVGRVAFVLPRWMTYQSIVRDKLLPAVVITASTEADELELPMNWGTAGNLPKYDGFWQVFPTAFEVRSI